MTLEVGIALAFVAMLCWGFGDFLIQRSTRKLGKWETLFVITAFGTIVLLPFVYKTLPSLLNGPKNSLIILTSAGLVLLCSALLNLEGLKRGKLSVLEPILALELISAAFLAYFVLGDRVTLWQGIVILVLLIFLFMVSFREKSISRKFFMEKGVIFLVIGGFLMGLADLFLGWGSRLTDPILANFIINVVIMFVTGTYIVLHRGTRHLMEDIKTNGALILAMAITDNVAWIAYAFAMSLVPIVIATGLSESSIIVAVLLGLFVTKEKLQRHQKIGLIGAIATAIVLAVITTA